MFRDSCVLVATLGACKPSQICQSKGAGQHVRLKCTLLDAQGHVWQGSHPAWHSYIFLCAPFGLLDHFGAALAAQAGMM